MLRIDGWTFTIPKRRFLSAATRPLALALVLAPAWPGAAILGAATAGAATLCVGDRCCSDESQQSGTGEADRLTGLRDADCLLGLGGDDRIRGRSGDDVIVAGSGADRVNAGPGDDVVVVWDACELARGERLSGGSGRDTLVLPIPPEGLRELGVRVSGFETVVVDASPRCQADCRLPCERTPPALRDLPDPGAWSVDPASGARFRRATREERRTNGWGDGTFLVESRALRAAVRGGDPAATLLVPRADGTVYHARLTLTDRRDDLEFVERRFTGQGLVSRLRRPVLYQYETAGLQRTAPRPVDGAWLGLLAGDDGGVYAYGLLDGVEIAVDAPNPGWALTAIAAPGGPPVVPTDLARVELLALGPFGERQAVDCGGGVGESCDWLCAEISGLPCDHGPPGGPGNVQHCIDGVDNDGDGKSDATDEDCAHHPDPYHSSEAVQDATWGCETHPGVDVHRWESGKSFALFGEGRFCTYYAGVVADPNAGGESGNWIQRLTRVGWDTEQFLREAATFSGLSGGEDEVRYVAGGCWIFPSMAAAEACADGGACPVADAAQYPYDHAGSLAANYYAKVWEDVQHATAYGLDQPLHLAQVVYFGGVSGAADPVDCSAEEGSGCCGAAPVASPGNDFADLDESVRGASLMQYNASVCNHKVVSAHEFGHSMGLDHDTASGPCPGSENSDCHGFMAATAGAVPVLSAQNQGQLDDCRLDWSCPRPSGFKYSGTPPMP